MFQGEILDCCELPAGYVLFEPFAVARWIHLNESLGCDESDPADTYVVTIGTNAIVRHKDVNSLVTGIGMNHDWDKAGIAGINREIPFDSRYV